METLDLIVSALLALSPMVMIILVSIDSDNEMRRLRERGRKIESEISKLRAQVSRG